jgi:hypothetical protein
MSLEILSVLFRKYKWNQEHPLFDKKMQIGNKKNGVYIKDVMNNDKI